MAEREWQIGICGTFDVQNYGDLLFPLIAERELAKRLGRVAIHPFSYAAKTADSWPYAVSSLEDFPEAVGTLDAVIIGGGHLIRFDKDVAPGYGPATPALHHPTAYWLTPALIALDHGVPVAWNAPSAQGDVPEWAHPLMHAAIGRSQYVSVRDDRSRQALAAFAGASPVVVAPDSVFGIGPMLSERPPSAELTALRERLELGERYLVVHATRGLHTFTRLAREEPSLRDYRLLSLPMGPALGDHDRLLGDDVSSMARLSGWPHPLVIAELIANASAVVGVSLHLAITALALGVPVFRPADTDGGKYAMLDAFDSVVRFPRNGPLELPAVLGHLGRRPPSDALREVFRRLDAHWDQLAAALVDEPGTRRARPGISPLLQALPHLLEGWAHRQDAAEARHEQEASLLKQESSQLREDASLLKAELAALYNSSSWRLTSPLRWVGRRLRRAPSPDGGK